MDKKESLSATFNELKNALMKNDVSKLDEIILDFYEGFSLNGTVETKAEILESFKPGGVKISKYSVDNLITDIHDNIGIITGKGEIKGSFESWEFHHDVLFTDIFLLVENDWKYYKSQVTEISSGS